MSLVGNSAGARELIYDEEGYVREGVVIVKLVRNYGPYGYRVHYERGLIGEGKHVWEYLGRAEEGIRIGTYAPGTPLKFYVGRQKHLQDRRCVLVGNWGDLRTDTDLELRLEGAGYLEEVVECCPQMTTRILMTRRKYSVPRYFP